MLASDQPTIFPSNLRVAVSSKKDGTMLDRTQDFHTQYVLENRQKFCKLAGTDYERCVYQLVTYEPNETYSKIVEVSANDTTPFVSGVHADALFTKEVGIGLFLPVADCVATVVYDPELRHLAMLHLGRHATYADLSTYTIKYFTERKSAVDDLIIWMSPSVGANSYKLDWFDRADDPRWTKYFFKKDEDFYIDLAGYNRQRFIDAGVPANNIVASAVDTAINEDYYSYSAGDVSGRIAVVAAML